MNDYRSTFYGVNDHEADWEQVFIYLEDAPDGPKPVWIAAAAHDYTGDELRRRWDDPTLEKVGDHLVINAGAGSHASYFERGEYLTEVPIPALRGLGSFLDVLRDFWRDTLRQPDPGDLRAALSSALSVPFVDYARGDGARRRTRRGGDLDARPHRRRRRLGRRLPRPVRSRHPRPVRRRARPGGPEVHARGHGPPVVERPARASPASTSRRRRGARRRSSASGSPSWRRKRPRSMPRSTG